MRHRRIHWRRYRTSGLIRYWDKEFTLLGEERSKERVEPWAKWWRRLASEIAAVLMLRHPHRQHAHAALDETMTGLRHVR